MFDYDHWQEIIGTLKKHKLRTFLTGLGVFWGIFMLMLVMGAGTGLENGVLRNFGNRAKNSVVVWGGRTTKPYKGLPPGRYTRLVLDDVEAVKNLESVDLVAPNYSLRDKLVSFKEQSGSWKVTGEMPDRMKVESLEIPEGRFINLNDIRENRKVAVLGQRVRTVLFGKENPIGKSINISGISYIVIGVVNPEKVNAENEESLESVSIPITTLYRSYGVNNRVFGFICTAKPNIPASQVEASVKTLLKQRHKISPDDPQGIGGFNLEKEFQQFRNLFFGIKLILGIVGIGTLLAGVIGVGNIMLITVKERTKEIGIRKALGATPFSIMKLIVTEAIFLTLIAGYLGLLSGTALINYIASLVESTEEGFFYNPEISLFIGSGAVIILVIAGGISGLIPAFIATKVNPVIALKDE